MLFRKSAASHPENGGPGRTWAPDLGVAYRFLLTFAGLVLLFSSLSSCRRESDHAPAPPASTSTSSPAADADEAPRATALLELMKKARPGEFDNDPHRIRCRSCHNPATGKVKEPLIETCSQSGCHARAWTTTIMHRVEPNIFLNCLNCHRPHVWRLDPADCAGCHTALAGPAGTVPAPDVAGADTFPHGKHQDLPCSTCHDSREQHARLTMTSFEQCMSCHHGPAAREKDCTTCHARASIAGPRRVSFTLTVAGRREERRLPFDHDRHAAVECATCHGEAFSAQPRVDCASCHGGHRPPLPDCATCHRPPPDGAHDLSVHEKHCASSGCHENVSIQGLGLTRPVCLSCHTDRTDHMPGRDCAGCHRIERGPAPGGAP